MKRKFFLFGLVAIMVFMLPQLSLQAQTNDTVTVNAEIRGHLTFVLDGTDASANINSGDYTSAETSDLGVGDAGGGAITGGDALVTGETGIPIDGTGSDLTAGDGFYDANCVGGFYRFFNASGATSLTAHDNAALGIYARGSRVTSYSLTTSAVVTPGTGDATVTVGQLKWKDDSTTGGSGDADYTDFAAGAANITSGAAGAFRISLFHDYGLLIEYADTPGTYTWTLTYTLTTT
jgi:hypothetical protein